MAELFRKAKNMEKERQFI
jgi:hypothetical protein